MAAAVSAEQLNSFLEKLDLLCEKLKFENCPVCNLKLNEDKSTCVNGHVVCGVCKLAVNFCPVCSVGYQEGNQSQGSLHPPTKRLRQSTPNGDTAAGGENLANNESIGIHCSNEVRGCEGFFAVDELPPHELSCMFRIYICKICKGGCCFRDLQSHCEKSHVKNVIKNSIFKVVSHSECPSGNRVYYFMQAQNEIFWFWRNNVDDRVYFGLQLCGDAERTKEFKYSLEIVSMNRKTSLKFNGPVLFDTDEMPGYSPSEDYIMVSKNILALDSKFKVTVRRIE